jgi:hypothetical protein
MHGTASGGLDSPGSKDFGAAAAAAAVDEKSQASEHLSAPAATEGKVAGTGGSGDPGRSVSTTSKQRWGSGSMRAVQDAKANNDASSAAEEEPAAAETAASSPAVAVVKESPAGEVRLVVAPDAAAAACAAPGVSSPAVLPAVAATHAGSSPCKQQQQQQRDEVQGLALQSAESLALTEAAAAAALAAAALAESEAAAAGGPPQHRVGPLRFMVQPSSRHASDAGVVQLQQDAAAATGDVAGLRVLDSSPTVPQKHQQQAELPDILPFEAVQHGSAAGVAAGAGMSQVVQDLFAAQGRTGPGGISSRRASAASGAAAANAATEEAVGHQPPRTR